MSLLTNNDLGQLYSIPEEDWTAINKRVGATAAASGIANYIENYIPEFPNLIHVCELWKTQTFNGLINQSAAISQYTGTAVNRFQTLLNVISTISPSETQVPEAVKEQTRQALIELSSTTTDLCKVNSEVNIQISNFLAINVKVDAQMLRFREKLGIFWEPLGQTITRVENATGLVTGSWLAIATDLENYAKLSPSVTMPFILQLDIEAAIVSWKSLQAEANAFMQISKNQKQYWALENSLTQPNLN